MSAFSSIQWNQKALYQQCTKNAETDTMTTDVFFSPSDVRVIQRALLCAEKTKQRLEPGNNVVGRLEHQALADRKLQRSVASLRSICFDMWSKQLQKQLHLYAKRSIAISLIKHKPSGIIKMTNRCKCKEIIWLTEMAPGLR